MKDKYEDAIDILKKLNEFQRKNKIDLKQHELIVLNWCKIKRDASRSKAYQSKYELNLKYESISQHLNINKRPFNHLIYLKNYVN